MFYKLGIYLRRYWHVLALLFICGCAALFVYLFRDSISFDTSKYSNKIDLTPTEYEEEPYDLNANSLADLENVAPYTFTDTFVPTRVKEAKEEPVYKQSISKDPEYSYKRDISWAKGELTQDEFDDLVELIGYHLNAMSSNTIIVSCIDPTEFDKAGMNVYFYTDGTGTLYINLKVEEYNETSSTKKLYYKSFALKYDTNGYIKIS